MYRQNRIARAAEFAEAVGVARMLTTEYAELTKRIQTLGYAEVEPRAATLWRVIWLQLGRAREIARQSGREVMVFAPSPHAVRLAIYPVGECEIHCAPFDQPRAAIAALIAAVPEVEIPPEPSSIVPNVRVEVPWMPIAFASLCAVLAMLVALWN
jgi:hypothetical protein